MSPTLSDGQGLVALSGGTPRPGQIRCLEHPNRPGFWLVKRVESVDGEQMTVSSDNLSVPAVDSREFGAVPHAGTYRVVVRIPLRLM